MNKKILLSFMTVVLVAGAAVWGTSAYFNDTETSTGNTFQAGSVDLKISNQSYVSNQTTGKLEYSDATSWDSKDLVEEKFFDFEDLKPGDVGEDTINLTVINNDAWACAEVTLTSNKDNGCSEPEMENDGTCDSNSTDLMDGELAETIEFIWWSDDGDNVLEVDEEASKYYLGPDTISNLLVGGKLQLTLADQYLNFFDRTRVDRQEVVLPLEGEKTYYIGKAWCFGEMELDPVAQDGYNTSGPLIRGTGFKCDGSNVNNATQTDSLTADIEFFAVQSRNNMDFLCPEHREPVVFAYNQQTSPGHADNVAGQHTYGTEDPYVTGVPVAGGVELTFHNPTPWLYVFDVKVDGQVGVDRIVGATNLTNMNIGEGPLAAQTWGPTYQRVVVDGSASQHIVTQTFSGNSSIAITLREGAERMLYFDWIEYLAQ